MTITDVLSGAARWAVVHGEALATLATMPDASVDAVVMDPPYCSGAISEAARTRAPGQGLRSDTISRFGWFVGDNMGTAGLVWLLRAVAWESLRVVKQSGHLVVFCDWRMVPSIEPAIESCGWRWQAMVVWNKGSLGLGTGFRHQHEIALHFTAGAPEYHDRAVGDVLSADRITGEERAHQTEKPIDLLRPIVRVTCPPGGVILDPFGGSMTTVAAALLEGRRAIGIEREAAYVEIGRTRCANVAAGNPPAPREIKQIAMFPEVKP